jgi:hypothetical protein
MEQLGNEYIDFDEIWYLRILRKIIKPFRFCFTQHNFNNHSTKGDTIFYAILWL